MALSLPTIIIRHRRENLKKCSLSGLRTTHPIQLYHYPMAFPPPSLESYVVLSLDGPVLSKQDQSAGICLIDGTWKYATKIQCYLQRHFPILVMRSLPKECKSAYPRRQNHCADPSRGLASIEALFFSYLLLGYDPSELLQNYYWKELFLSLNFQFISALKKQTN